MCRVATTAIRRRSFVVVDHQLSAPHPDVRPLAAHVNESDPLWPSPIVQRMVHLMLEPDNSTSDSPAHSRHGDYPSW